MPPPIVFHCVVAAANVNSIIFQLRVAKEVRATYISVVDVFFGVASISVIQVCLLGDDSLQLLYVTDLDLTTENDYQAHTNSINSANIQFLAFELLTS